MNLDFFRSISEKSAFPGKNVVHEMDLMTDLLGKPSMGTDLLRHKVLRFCKILKAWTNDEYPDFTILYM